MKKIVSLSFLIAVVGICSMSAQNFKYITKSSADCTDLKSEFTVPDGKVAKLMSMEVITSFNTCDASHAAPTSNIVRVYEKQASGANSKPKTLYKKTVMNDGSVTESVPIQDVKLNPGTYVLEVSKAPQLEAKLEIFVN